MMDKNRRSDLQRRALDEPRRLTLAEIAKAVGVSRAALTKYREGSRQMPTDVRKKLAALLTKHARELLRIADRLRRA